MIFCLGCWGFCDPVFVDDGVFLYECRLLVKEQKRNWRGYPCDFHVRHKWKLQKWPKCSDTREFTVTFIMKTLKYLNFLDCTQDRPPGSEDITRKKKWLSLTDFIDLFKIKSLLLPLLYSFPLSIPLLLSCFYKKHSSLVIDPNPHILR